MCDARLLVNLVHPGLPGESFLDPFAGGAGLVVEALASGHRVLTSDIDPRLRFGLAATGATHCVADARRLPFGEGRIAAIATELPFDLASASLLDGAFFEMQAALRPGGRLSLMCAIWQRDPLQVAAGRLGLVAQLDTAIDRKGTPCAVLVWVKAPPSGRPGLAEQPTA